MDLTGFVRRAYEFLFGGPSNLSTAERVGSVIFGLAAFATAARRRPMQGVLLAASGLALVARGTSGHCPVKAAMTERGESRRLGRAHGRGREEMSAESGRYEAIEREPAPARFG